MQQEVVSSKKLNVQDAVNEVLYQLKRKPSDYSAVIFFAGTRYDFTELSEALHQQFSGVQIIGASTSGEITPNGFDNDSLVLNALYECRGGGCQVFGSSY